MIYHPVVERFALPVALDPFAGLVLLAAFAAAVWATVRRPAYGACALLVAIPFDFQHYVFATTVSLPKAVLLGVLLGLCARPECLARLRDRPAPLLLGLLAAYAAAIAVSFAHAEYPGTVAREAFKAIEYGLTFAAAYLCRRIDPDDRALRVALAGVTIVVACGALAQELTGAPSGLHAGARLVPRIAGALDGPNQLAGYLAIAIAALGAWRLRRPAVLPSVALALAAAAGMLTFSRGWLLDAAIVTVVLIAAGGRGAWRKLWPLYAGAASGAAGVAGWGLASHSLDVLRFSGDATGYAGGVGNRGELWQAALRMWRRHPIAGVGAGNYELLLPRYGVSGVRTHPNSWYLASLAEGGLVLFAATIALVAGSIATFTRGLGRSTNAWILAALAASCALAIHQFADYLTFYPKVAATWWLLAGLAASALAGGE